MTVEPWMFWTLLVITIIGLPLAFGVGYEEGRRERDRKKT